MGVLARLHEQDLGSLHLAVEEIHDAAQLRRRVFEEEHNPQLTFAEVVLDEIEVVVDRELIAGCEFPDGVVNG